MVEIQYGTVRGQYRWLQGPSDVAATGSITFVPVEPDEIVDGETVYARKKVIAALNDEGWIHIDGSAGDELTLAAGRWAATLNIDGMDGEQFPFDVPADGVVSLPEMAPLKPGPMERFIVNEFVMVQTLAARDAALEAQEAAELAASEAEAPTIEVVDARIDTHKGTAGGLAELGDDSKILEEQVPDRLSEEELLGTFGAAAVAASPEVGARIAAATDKILPYPLDGSWPIFKRLNGGAPVFTQATQNPASSALTPQTSVSIYWPWIIDARKILGSSALDEFYLFYSTDHASHSDSGVWLATGPTELGPWTGRGRVYRDDTAGAQTETPSVFADPTGAKKLVMLYQQQGVPGANGTQSTVYATSDDGITWTRGGLAIDIPTTTWPGDGHTGYATLTAIGARLFSHHLAGGGNFPTFGLSTSIDGRTWRLQADPLLYNMDVTGDGRRIEWNTTSIVMWRGELWWIGYSSNFVSGDTTKDARLVIAPISDDLRTFKAPAKRILFPTVGDENTNYRSCHAFTARDGRIIFYYQCGNSFFAASTEV